MRLPVPGHPRRGPVPDAPPCREHARRRLPVPWAPCRAAPRAVAAPLRPVPGTSTPGPAGSQVVAGDALGGGVVGGSVGEAVALSDGVGETGGSDGPPPGAEAEGPEPVGEPPPEVVAG